MRIDSFLSESFFFLLQLFIFPIKLRSFGNQLILNLHLQILKLLNHQLLLNFLSLLNLSKLGIKPFLGVDQLLVAPLQLLTQGLQFLVIVDQVRETDSQGLVDACRGVCLHGGAGTDMMRLRTRAVGLKDFCELRPKVAIVRDSGSHTTNALQELLLSLSNLLLCLVSDGLNKTWISI